MDELLSDDYDKTIKDEVISLITTAILRKHQRSQKKEPDLLDNSATLCMTVNTAQKPTETPNE